MGASASAELPEKMRKIVLTEPNVDMDKARLEIQEAPLPTPKSGEVLVKMVAAPVNPSDYGEWRLSAAGKDGIGKEGAGIVVASGGGVLANRLVGKAVGVANLGRGQGTYQEYCVVSAMTGCFSLPEMPVEDAGSFFVNPYTAVGFVDTVRSIGSPGLVHSAAASQLGQMLVKLCKREKLVLVNVVRRPAQAEALRALGAEHIVVTAEAGWKEELARIVKELKITVAFDAVAGESSGDLLAALPPKGTCFVYGGLSEQGCSGIHPMDLIYRQKRLEGWFLKTWLGSGLGALRRLTTASTLVNDGLADGWSTTKFVDCSPENMWTSFLELRKDGCTNKKLRIRWDKN